MRRPAAPRAVEVASSSTATTAAPYFTGADVSPPAGPGQSHFLHIDDWSRERLDAVLATAAAVKAKLAARDESFKPFAGKTMSMIFTKPSMRTRVSFETVSRRVGVVRGCER
jgi:ornithine carbamoyltransferase